MSRSPITQHVQHEGLHFRVERRGHGPVVLLLHGFPDSLRLWDAVAPRLEAAGCHVIAVDQRGCGASDAPVGRQHYHIERLVGDAAGVLKALGVREPVHVMGHDWGAVVAWCLAITRPATVRSAVAISVGHPTEYALAGFEQRRKGLYTIGWQFVGLAERWLTAGNWARMRHWLRQHPDPDSRIDDLARPGRLTAGLNLVPGLPAIDAAQVLAAVQGADAGHQGRSSAGSETFMPPCSTLSAPTWTTTSSSFNNSSRS